MQMSYNGGHRAPVTVVLPERTLQVLSGDTVDVSEDEAARLTGLPGWTPAEGAEKAPESVPEPSGDGDKADEANEPETAPEGAEADNDEDNEAGEPAGEED